MMKATVASVILLLGLSACDQAKEAGDDAAREMTGSNMVQQEKAMKQQIQQVEKLQAERTKQLDQ